MKHLLFTLGLFIFLTSCKKEPEHTIRIQNNSAATISDMKIRDVEYGTIEIGGTTDYLLLGEVNTETVTGTYAGMFQFLMTVDINKKGKSNWTLTFNNIDTTTGDINADFREENQ